MTLLLGFVSISRSERHFCVSHSRRNKEIEGWTGERKLGRIKTQWMQVDACKILRNPGIISTLFYGKLAR
jgi:hypothetical protein